MLQLKEVKRQIVAGPATKTFDFFIQWHLTERCNLRCRHCYQQRRKAREMSVDELKQHIDGATEMLEAWEKEYDISLSPSINFTGGEPFLYRGLWDAIMHARQSGYKIAILTNGCLITEEDSRKASSLGIEDIQVSLEGPPEIHDSIRGQGSFAAAVKGARLLIDAGNCVSANMTLSRLNIDCSEETAKIAEAAGFSGIGFSRLVPCGSGENLLDSLLTAKEIKAGYQRVLALDSPSFEVASGDPLAGVLSGFKPSPESELALSGCSAGFSGVTITSDGSVMPCRRIGLKIGNLRKTSLRQIWSTSKILWRLRQRESYKGECGRCSLWPSCRGCRAVAYAYSKSQGASNLFADDPQCWLVHPEKPDATDS
ncbi:MAG: radical SAM protein [Syntrophales bacterium]|jgi:radical SAM protein with 4Fe4S-binding SPASM domain